MRPSDVVVSAGVMVVGGPVEVSEVVQIVVETTVEVSGLTFVVVTASVVVVTSGIVVGAVVVLCASEDVGANVVVEGSVGVVDAIFVV